MAQVDYKRAMVERLVQTTRDEAAYRRRSVETIDPIIRAGRKMYPYLSERELIDCASSALRVILSNRGSDPRQMTFISY
ncbi:TPA: hypothetical protein HA344_04695 [Candidatus Bathyarchaeota archaeon]|nr:hypothetical protein [Candidatus Bathyarchaeota archaeon]